MACAISQNYYECGVCHQNANTASIRCDYCMEWLHYHCTELPLYQLLDLEKSNKKFRCRFCCLKKYPDFHLRIKEYKVAIDVFLDRQSEPAKSDLINSLDLSSLAATPKLPSGNKEPIEKYDTAVKEKMSLPDKNSLNEQYNLLLNTGTPANLRSMLKPHRLTTDVDYLNNSSSSLTVLGGGSEDETNRCDNHLSLLKLGNTETEYKLNKCENNSAPSQKMSNLSDRKRNSDITINNIDGGKNINERMDGNKKENVLTWPNNVPLQNRRLNNDKNNKSNQHRINPICKFYKMNKCMKGNNCEYRHPVLCNRYLTAGSDSKLG